ncbi:MAG TPA: WYL domain-containing protein [Edaphobacter sp.]|uniref:helix-turn-helix transcriptional regulator n=1 Tax=Edaphobacter sp. TaxID=1934404 RepID=UPI002BB2EE7C|nr:WYL domain-containing protein [Edaphobacter sp.]HUZ95448.1 WYL domain-containing protein [Edaphobacter sp.]
MRYEKAETILRIALDMQGSGEGLTIDDIRIRYGDEPLSRRTAERLRDAVERVFPQVEQANPGETPKRWRIRSGTLSGLVGLSAEEVAALGTAETVLKRENANAAADALGSLAAKLRATIRPEVTRRIEPDAELLLEAEGLAMRPGPRPKVDSETLATLRQAILASRKVRLHYQARSTGTRSRQLVCPYGFLYGNRPYVVAYSMNSAVRDYRLFSLANISAVDLTAFSFLRRADFSLADFARRSFGVFQEEPFDVVWRFSPEVAADAREWVFHPDQTIEDQPDGSLTVRFRAGGALEMSWHLYTWGDTVEVLEPKDFRNRVKRSIGECQ